MRNRSNTARNRAFVFTGLGTALLIAVFLSPWASSNPDGLDRVSQDQGFHTRAVENPPAHKLPFYGIFNEYALRGVPDAIATPLAGLAGTLATFGIAWAVGKLVVRGKDSTTTASDSNSSD